ncbi:major facilitator superfamily domain-containing protein 6-like [Ochotona curzoniae]|uniref:major facilitator superfamily domain-containing protein 6-like n=1 Tax=Ochotona curzoniae TaxID=130825 RepID=UPI001B35419C|nr:major facilitator superfamily domain-containing protein 6-like [Ochotona curzoniae]
MNANPQWDVSRALGVARLFQVVCGVRDGSVTPFLTLYLRQLGLAAPWVGVLMGTKHLVAAFWAPFCAFVAQRYQKRRALLTGSLLGSMGASLLVVLVPPMPQELGLSPCDVESRITTVTAQPLEVTVSLNFTSPNLESSLVLGSHPAEVPHLSHRRSPGLGGLGRNAQDTFQGPPGHLTGSVAETRTTTRVLLPDPVAVEEDAHAWDGALEVVNSALALMPGDASEPGNTAISNMSATAEEGQALDHPWEGLRWTFALALGSVVLWELLTTPLEPVVDDSLYEHLDCVDATDRYNSLWMWRSLGLVAGACSIAALVEQLGCFLEAGGPQGAVHFYSYSAVSLVALLVSLAIPIPKCLPQVPRPRTLKALTLVGGAPRLILLALTVVLLGAVASTVQNFLFWHMRDHGSSELVMALAFALGLLGEMALHPWKSVLLGKVSRAAAVGLGLACLAGQLLYYSFLWSWWSVLPAQALSAFSSGALWWAVGASLEDLATSGTERPLSGMFREHLYGGGCSLGSFIGGFVVMRFGLATLYQACCLLLMLWLALYLAVQPKLPQERSINYSKLLAVETSDTSDSEPGLDQDWFVKAMKEDHAPWKG